MKFTYNWKISDLEKVEKNGLKVFSCFACGGGSSFGYKMSGFDVIGCNEIDPEMMEIYKANHNPKFHFLESIETFRLRNDLPQELFDLDILDGSPPCSSFSMAGNREKNWGEKKEFREGQAEQVLDDLFFHYIALAKKLKPKVVIAENVKGMLMGNAKGYVKKILRDFDEAGYDVQLFLLNAATMGVPQRRERIFFVGRRKDLKLPKLEINFNEKPISVLEALETIKDINYKGKDKSHTKLNNYWNLLKPGKPFSTVHPKKHWFNFYKLPKHQPAPTITAIDTLLHFESCRSMSRYEACVLGSFPIDYKFKSDDLAIYQVGMSVPPLMTHKLSEQIYLQLFKK